MATQVSNIEWCIEELLNSKKCFSIGIKDGLYHAFTKDTQGSGISAETAIEQLLIKIIQESPKENSWGI